MSHKTTIRLAWALGLVALTLAVVTVILTLDDYSFPRVTNVPNFFNDITSALLALITVLLGAFVVARRPRNVTGWLLLLIGLPNLFSSVSTEYSIYTILVNPGALPGGIWMTWLSQWQWTLIFTFLSLLLLVFPTGHLLSPRWRWLVYVEIFAFAVLWLLSVLVTPVYVNGDSTHAVANPLGPLAIISEDSIQIFNPVATAILSFSLFAGALALFIRFYRSRGDERAQLKWFTYATVLAVLVWQMANVLSIFGPWTGVLSNLGFILLPITLAIAMLKYRLYDIDVIIRRTVTYALVAAMLAAVYFGSVILLQQAFASVTGQRSEVITVLSTLAIAALFVPLRNSIQTEIDKRFNRKKYDAQQVLNEFAKTVRDETDLGNLTARLMQVVDETMQPKSVSVWLKAAHDEQQRTRQ